MLILMAKHLHVSFSSSFSLSFFLSFFCCLSYSSVLGRAARYVMYFIRLGQFGKNLFMDSFVCPSSFLEGS
ncbi:hypothetical protein QBC44DRAFT_325489 [Cladorrhinum sp. PSN332]|nr:hypothetical protein QBC44DRAFT_325489 [Cladorrhinum sp. PSN332]